MATMTTVLNEYNDEKNRRTFKIDGHTISDPRLVIQKRIEADSVDGKSSDNLQVVYGTDDDAGTPLDLRIVFSADVRRPANATAATITAALATFRDLVNSDEFTALVTSQSYIK